MKHVAAFLLFVVACGESRPPEPLPPPSLEYSLRVEPTTETWVPTSGVPLVIDGEEVGTLRAFDSLRISRPLHAPLDGEAPVTIEARIATPCGPRPVPLRLVELTRDAGFGRNSFSARLEAVAPPQSTTLFVDFRGPAATIPVVVNGTPLPAADSVTRHNGVLGLCGSEIAIGDNVVNIPDGSGAVLVDPTGARCYERRTLLYAVDGVNVDPNEQPQRFEGALTHEVGLVDFLLTPPATTISNDLGIATRTSLADCPPRRRRR